MSKEKKWMIAGIIMVAVGIVLSVAALTLYTIGNRSKKPVNVGIGAKYVTNTYEVGEFDDIEITAKIERINFKPSDTGKGYVVCYEDADFLHVVKDENRVLKITDTYDSFLNFTFTVETPTITVFLPKSEYSKLKIDSETGDVDIPENFSFESIDIKLSTGDVNMGSSCRGDMDIKTSTGKIEVNDISADDVTLRTSTGSIKASGIKCGGEMNVDVSTGKCNLSDIVCESFYSTGSTGKVTLTGVKAQNRFSVERSTGDINIKGCDAENVHLKTATGDITGSLCTGKDFSTDTNTGKVSVPESAGTGKCSVSTNTGNINISVE
ncbi:MAG: DUF4097 family beta strand repeat-containing protein [Eubacteriales bacterium]|nr:DUF4097 family beta strand repeat-containing protein [Eubacteriales bacterium]